MTLKQLIGLVISLPIWLGGWWGIWWIGHLSAYTWPLPPGDMGPSWYFLPMLFTASIWLGLGWLIIWALFRKELQ